jgi:hypothetical protein
LKRTATLIISCLFTAISLYGTTCRAIILADTASNLSIPAKKDVTYLRQALTKICTKTGLELSIDIIDGPYLGHHNVYSALTAPANNDADVLFFYYTGHGYHPSKTTTPWPTIMLSVTKEALDTERICKVLSAYKARLTIVLFDCCNSTCDINIVPKNVSTRNSNHKHPRNFKKLFLRNSGTIIATASHKGHPAYAFNKGSLFTTTLLKSLFDVDQVHNDCWSTIFDQVCIQCRPYQTPYVFLDLREEPNE